MTETKRSLTGKILSIVLLLIVASIVFSLINVKDFSVDFLVDKENSTLAIDMVELKGSLRKFPFNIYHIKGKLTIGSTEYEIIRYKKEKANPFPLHKYTLFFIDKNKKDSFYGRVRLDANIFTNNAKNIYLSTDEINKSNGMSSSEVIYASIIE